MNEYLFEYDFGGSTWGITVHAANAIEAREKIKAVRGARFKSEIVATDTRKTELEWLARQNLPVWGGHLERGEPISDPQMRVWVADGVIQSVAKPCLGYVITEKGRALIAPSA